MSALQTTPAPLASSPEPRKSSIELLPPDFREPVRFFYGFWSDTLRGTTGIATRFRWWIREEGLTIEEATEAMRRVMSPERSAEMENSPKALAVLSAEVAAIIRERKVREKQQAERDRAEFEKSCSVSADEYRRMTAGIGQPV